MSSRRFLQRHRDETTGAWTSATARGYADDWATLSGVVAAVDPRTLLRSDHPPMAMALEATLMAAVTDGITELPIPALAASLGLTQKALKANLARLMRETAASKHGHDKRRVHVELHGKLVRITWMQRLVYDQAVYARIPPGILAQAPSARHARTLLVFAFAATATRTAYGTRDVDVGELRSWLRLAPSADPVAALLEMQPWAQKIFGCHELHAKHLEDGKCQVQAWAIDNNRFLAVPGQRRRFDADTYRVGHFGSAIKSYWIADGVISGHELTVRPVVAAKMWEFCKEAFGIAAPFREIRWLWLSAVDAWSAGNETALPFWPVAKFQEAFGRGLSATNAFAEFAQLAAEASEGAKAAHGHKHGLLWRVMDTEGRKLESARIGRLMAARRGEDSAAWAEQAEEVVSALRSEGADELAVSVKLASENAVVGKSPVQKTDGAPVSRITRDMPFRRLRAEEIARRVDGKVASYGGAFLVPLPEATADRVAAMAKQVAVAVVAASKMDFSYSASGQTVQQNVICRLAYDSLRMLILDGAARAEWMSLKSQWQAWSGEVLDAVVDRRRAGDHNHICAPELEEAVSRLIEVAWADADDARNKAA